MIDVRTYRTTQSTPIKVWTDATRREDGTAGAGWIVTDHNGKVMHFDNRTLGKTENGSHDDWGSTGAELRSIEIAVQYIESKCVAEHVVVCADCNPAVETARETIDTDIEYVRYEIVDRSENALADLMATLSLGRDELPYWMEDE